MGYRFADTTYINEAGETVLAFGWFGFFGGWLLIGLGWGIFAIRHDDKK